MADLVDQHVAPVDRWQDVAMSRDTTDYLFGYSREELERLGNQHRVWAEDNRRFLARAGFGEGATVVDLGCGPGYTTLDLARLVGPAGRVIAVDRDAERSLPLLQQRAETAGLSNVETRSADLETFDLPAGGVDGVYGRLVLMYLPEAAVAALVARAAKWLRPGGTCALAEFCNYRHFHVHPPSEHLSVITEALMQAIAGDRGCNPQIGNVLPGLLDGAGLHVEFHVNTKAVRATTPEWSWPDTFFRGHLPELVDSGYLDPGVLEAFLTDWEARSLDPKAMYFSAPFMEVWGRRLE